MHNTVPSGSADYSSLTHLERDNLGWVKDLAIEFQRALASDPSSEVRLSFLLGSRERDREVLRHMEVAETDRDVLSVMGDQVYASPTIKRQLTLEEITSTAWLDIVCEELSVSDSIKSALWKQRSSVAAPNTTFGEALDRLLAAELIERYS